MTIQPKGTLLSYEVYVQHTTTYRTVVHAPGPADAGVLVGDQLRAEDYSGLEVVHRIINGIEIHRISPDEE